MGRTFAQASRGGQPLSALMVDLDHFKALNDQFGHRKGDDMLAAFGTSLSLELRRSDFAARYGGEEFLVLLPATGPEGTLAVAEKVHHAIQRIHVPDCDREITASIGVATLPDHAVDAERLLRAADRALYVAKARGRDRTALATDVVESGEIDRLVDPIA
jgi:diguanylate cyclase (GGDEF)-like protein